MPDIKKTQFLMVYCLSFDYKRAVQVPYSYPENQSTPNHDLLPLSRLEMQGSSIPTILGPYELCFMSSFTSATLSLILRLARSSCRTFSC
jgi:hypothetical protein